MNFGAGQRPAFEDYQDYLGSIIEGPQPRIGPGSLAALFVRARGTPRPVIRCEQVYRNQQ